MKEARYLLRLAPLSPHNPSESLALLRQVRKLLTQGNGKAINLRVTSLAIEFDLFCEPQMDAQPFLDALQPLGKVITCKRLDVPPGSIEPQKIVNEAKQLFSEHRFWEVHEVLEGLWKELKGSEKQFVQGIILVAAALVHVQKDEVSVARTMFEDALKRLPDRMSDYYGWNISELKKQARNFFT